MKPAVTRLYFVLVALTLVALVAWAGADWYQLQQKATLQAQATLRQVAGVVSDLTLRGPLEAGTVSRAFAARTGNDGRWKVILLESPDRGTEYYRGPRPMVTVEKVVPHWEPRAWADVKIQLPVFRTASTAMTIEGIYEFYGRAEIFQFLKATGITLVVLLLLTSALVALTARTRDPEERPQPADPQGDPPQPASDPFEFSDELPALEVEPTSTDREDEYWFDDGLTLEDLPPLEATIAEESSPAAPKGPSLFSPTTGLGWEEFLLTRLDNELDRAASQNQDLAVVLLGPKSGHVDQDAWGRAVKAAFPSIDLDFEYQGGAAIVLPGKSLEQALKAVRSFVDGLDRRGEAVFHAGVAARSGRLVSATVVLQEADSALRRSLAGTVRVLGLKTDADRYREHLASQSA